MKEEKKYEIGKERQKYREEKRRRKNGKKN
jgi:hypothetical protein